MAGSKNLLRVDTVGRRKHPLKITTWRPFSLQGLSHINLGDIISTLPLKSIWTSKALLLKSWRELPQKLQGRVHYRMKVLISLQSSQETPPRRCLSQPDIRGAPVTVTHSLWALQMVEFPVIARKAGLHPCSRVLLSVDPWWWEEEAPLLTSNRNSIILVKYTSPMVVEMLVWAAVKSSLGRIDSKWPLLQLLLPTGL